MVRPQIKRRIRKSPRITYYKPRGIPLKELDEVVITEDLFEAIRLVDLNDLYQDAAAEKMGVSRPTISRMLSQGRKLIAEALMKGKAIRIEREVFMPGRNGTGPMGKGPMTGRGVGKCGGSGPGCGIGQGRGMGRKFGKRNGMGNIEDEKANINEEIRSLQGDLDELKRYLTELENRKK